MKNKNQKNEATWFQANLLEILNSMDTLLMVTEHESYNILFANDKIKRFYGLNYDPTGIPCYKAFHGFNSRCDFCKRPEKVKDGDEVVEWEYYNQALGRWLHKRESFIHWSNDSLAHLQQGIDITMTKEAALDCFSEREQARRESHAKSEFLSMISHEIRTPLNVIIGMSKLANESDNIEYIHGCLDKVNDSSIHLLGVVNDVLDMSKIEAGKVELSPSDFVLEQMIERVININNFRFEWKKQDFYVSVDPNCPEAIVADQQRIAQVLTNLLSNATKFTPDYGEVRLSINLKNEKNNMLELEFVVEDSGVGMTKEQQTRLFQPFEQADNSTTRVYGGTGLGLSISKAIIELMSGHIKVKSVLGKGTSFVFTIKVRRGISKNITHISKNIDKNKIKFLVVRDNVALNPDSMEIPGMLDFQHDISYGSDDALAKLQEHDYDIVFLNRKLPGKDRIGLVEEIKKIRKNQIIVMIISMNQWADIEGLAKAAGVHSCINTPLLPSKLVDCINRCLDKKYKRNKLGSDEKANYTDLFYGRRILLVEDVEINRTIVKELLRSTGVEIIEADNGKTACDIYSEQHGTIDIILMDIHMPNMDGITATKTIRSMKGTSRAATVPIIGITADVFQEDVERYLSAGMNTYVGKPVDIKTIISAMLQYLPSNPALSTVDNKKTR